MKYFWRRILSAILAFMLVLSMMPVVPISAQAAGESDLTFKLNTDKVSYSVVDCAESASGALTIPAAYNGKPVTSIGIYAFSSCKSLTSVTISEGVIRIDDYAFYSCSGLTDITIPDSVTSIGDQAFYSCTGLTGISIPDSITSIGWSAFSGCTNLYYNTYNQAKFLGNDTNPYVALMTADASVQSYSVPNGTKLIATDAFQNCSSLTSVTIPDSVTHIGTRAFYYCTNLTSVILGNSVVGIGESAFNYCTSLTSIAIPASVTSIGSAAFSGCDALDAVYITDIAAWCNIAFDGASANPLLYAGYLYLNGEPVTDPVIPDHVTIIRDYAFYDYYGLNSITIPSSVTTIGNSAFYYCHRLKAVHITDIAAWCNIAFYDQLTNPLYYAGKLYLNGELVTDLVIPDNVTAVGNYAFYDYDQLTSITIPTSVKKIGTNAFAKCDALAHIWYYGSENDAKSITGKPSATWHYNYCGPDNHTYDNSCDSVCNTCDYTREVSHVYDDADDLTCNACKETLAPAAPSDWDSLVTDTTVTLPAIDGYEYSMDATTWQTSNVFTGLQPATSYIFYQRVAASADNLVSPASSPTTIKTRKSATAAPAAPVLEAKTSTTVTLQAQSGYEYSKNGYTWQTSNQFTGLSPETQYTFFQRIAETDTGYASAASTPITVTTLRAFTVTYDTLGGSDAPAAQQKDQGIDLVLSSTVSTYSSYLFKGWSTRPYGEVAYSGGDTYTTDADITLYAVWVQRCYTCSGNGYTLVPCSLCDGTGTWWGPISTCCYARTAYVQITHGSSYYMCRSCGKACDVTNGGADCETTQKSVCTACSGDGYQKQTPPAPAQPELSSATSSVITVVPHPGMEYSIDGITWQTGNIFEALSPNTRYTIYQRYTENTYYNAGTASEALPVITPKNTHSTPPAPTLSSRTSDTVVLVSVPGCEYSKDGIIWQKENVFENLAPSTEYVFYQRKYEDAQNYASVPSAGLYVTTEDPQYTVVFKDWDGAIISQQTYYWGDAITPPADPVRTADDTYTYTFAGWSPEIVSCAGNATYTATYIAHKKPVVTVLPGGEFVHYTTLNDAVSAAHGSSILQLFGNIEEDVVISKDLVLDLNGFDITGNITVTSGAAFSVKDSQTDDYTIEDCNGYGKIIGTISGVQAEVGYMMITEPDGVSFHRIDLQLTDMSLRASAVGVYYKCNFAGDEIVAQRVDRYGVALSVDGEPTDDAPGICSWYGSFTPGNGGNSANGTLLHGVMKTTNTESVNAENAEMAIYGRAYILTKDGQYIFGECVSRSFREQVELVDDQWSDLTAEQQLAVLNMYKSYESIIGKWDIPNILTAA